MNKKYKALCYSAVFFAQLLFGFSVDEIKLGVLRHDTSWKLAFRHEKSPDLHAEILLAPFEHPVSRFLFSPRLHVGCEINTRGGTNIFYTGMTWTLDLTDWLFIDAGFGGAINTGQLKTPSKHKHPMGSHITFHESIALGVRLNRHINMSLYSAHSSNNNLSEPNMGMTNLGIRMGYHF